ncbi:MAG: ROK family protein [Halocynthiibacter sp.]
MQSRPDNARLLVADIGGTNTRIALWEGDSLRKETVARFRNAEFPTLGDVLSTYLRRHGRPPCDGACVAVAGPVHDGVGHLTNLDWAIDSQSLALAAGVGTTPGDVAILNDLQAQGYALGRLQPGTCLAVSDGQPAPDKPPDEPPDPRAGAQLVVGIGTGFNAAVVHETRSGRLVVASECGHMSLPARNESDFRFARHLESRHHGFCAVEDVLSGRGLERACQWIAVQSGSSDSRDAATIVADAATGDARASAALRLCCGLLGTVCGDLALSHLPFGGIYLVGGVARAFQPYLQSHGFTEAFSNKGRFSTFMTRFSVSVVSDDFAALTGCAMHLKALRPQPRQFA